MKRQRCLYSPHHFPDVVDFLLNKEFSLRQCQLFTFMPISAAYFRNTASSAYCSSAPAFSKASGVDQSLDRHGHGYRGFSTLIR